MIGSTAVRIYIVAAVVLAVYGGSRLVKASLQPPEVVLPSWTFDQLPVQLGDWRGAKTELDPEIAVATGAELNRIVDREYRDDRGHAVSMHTAMFKDLAAGVYHAPFNCYRSKGWQKMKDTTANLVIDDGLTIPVSLTTWDKDGERALVVFWYQLGEHVLFERWDLGTKVRWAMRGQPKWPALIKVMLQIQVHEQEDAKAAILGFAEQVAKWENQPGHRKDWRPFDKTSKGG